MDINIILFDKFESLDIFGPVEVLAKNKDHVLHYYSLQGGHIVSAQGVLIVTLPLCEANKEGMMVLPGGQGTRQLVSDDKFLNTLKNMCVTSKYVLSICTGSALLAKAGILDGKKATSNKRAFSWVVSTSDKVIWQKKARWVVDGKFYTSSGVSAGIDMTLGFMADLYGIQTAKKIAYDIEYIWNENCKEDLFAQEL